MKNQAFNTQSIQKLTLETVRISDLRPNPDNARKHPPEQLAKLKASIARFRLVVPLIIDADNLIRAGNGTYLACKALGLTELDCYRLTHLSDDELIAFELAHNRIAELSEDDVDIVARKLVQLRDANFETDITGYDFRAYIDSVSDDDIPDVDEYSEPTPAQPAKPDEPKGVRVPILIELTKPQAKQAREQAKAAGFQNDWTGFFLHLLEKTK